jgi:hypothetical protein
LARARDWTANELGQFYRVEAALVQAGLKVETEKGLTDEGDPWFVFCRRDDGEVFIHFARIGASYVAVGATLESVARGGNFPALVDEMLATQAFAVARAHKRPGVLIHPAALLVALVGAAFFHSSQAKADEAVRETRTDGRRLAFPFFIGGGPTLLIDSAETAAVLSSFLASSAGPAEASIHQPATAVSDIFAVDMRAPIPFLATAGLMGPAEAAFYARPTDGGSGSRVLMHSSALNAFAPVEAQASLDPYPAVALDHGLDHGPALNLPAFAKGDASVLLAPPNVAVLVSVQSSQANAAVEAANVAGSAQVHPAAPFASDPALEGFLDTGLHITVVTASKGAGTSSGGQGSLGGPDASGGTHVGGVAVGGAAPATPVIISEAPPPDPVAHPAGLSANSPQVTAAIQHFSAEVGELDLANAAHGVVLYDGALFHGGGPIPGLDSVTFTFADGSSVSLVGTALEIQHLHLA